MSVNVEPPTPWSVRPWHWLTILSLDAPMVAVTWQRWFSRHLSFDLPWKQSIVLGGVVWLIYVCDRCLEAWRLPMERLVTRRHRFYRNAPLVWLTMLGGGVVALFGYVFSSLGRLEFEAGLLFALPVAAYVFSHQWLHRRHKARVPKELCIALLFPLGAALAPLTFRAAGLEQVLANALKVLPDLLAFTALCSLNLMLISLVEAGDDERQGQHSLALSAKSLKAWLYVVEALTFAAALAGLLSEAWQSAAGPLLVSSGLLCLLRLFRAKLDRETVRTLADVALLSPALWLAASSPRF